MNSLVKMATLPAELAAMPESMGTDVIRTNNAAKVLLMNFISNRF
jgi:hypothetical protein